MAFDISTNVPLISPAYVPIEFRLTDPSADYFEVEIHISTPDPGDPRNPGAVRILKIVANDAIVNIEGVLQPFFTSDASALPLFLKYRVWGTSVIGDSSTTTFVNDYFVFNGAPKGTWNFTDYFIDASYNQSKFLNNFNADIDIHHSGNNDPRLYFFRGIIGNDDGDYKIDNCEFEITIDGSTVTWPLHSTTGYPEIVEFKIDPSSLSPTINFSPLTQTYSIKPKTNTGNTELKIVNFVDQDERYTPHKVTWVDSMGVLNSFWFDLNQINTANITRETYNNNGITRQFNVKNKDQYSLTSNWITEKQSLALKDLWYSPSVMVDDEYAIILNKTVQILKRRDVKLINYTVDYELSEEFTVQIN